jgi:transcriptional regulator with XRE-family HTH domain
MPRKQLRQVLKKKATIEHHALKAIRLKLSLTQKEASKKLSIGHKALEAIENGRVALSRERIEEMMTSYGLTFLDYTRQKKVIKREGFKKTQRVTIKTVLTNKDRRSYQKIITKEAKTLRSMRRIKGLTQYEASRLCGYSKASIGHIENGRIEITKERVQHITTSYGYKYSDYEENLNKKELRDVVIDMCIEKIGLLNDDKLEVFKGLLSNF